MFEKANEYAKAEDAITAPKQSGTTWKPKKDTLTTGEVEVPITRTASVSPRNLWQSHTILPTAFPRQHF
jgi:hypothetical protein